VKDDESSEELQQRTDFEERPLALARSGVIVRKQGALLLHLGVSRKKCV
jgi:hypothetical protein